MSVKDSAGKLRYTASCPNCQSQMRVRTSTQLTSLTRISYCQCPNIKCGGIFRVHHEVVSTILAPLTQEQVIPPDASPEEINHLVEVVHHESNLLI